MARITKKTALAFLKSQFIMNLATISDARPHCSVLLYHVDNNFNFYFVTHTGAYKAKNIRKNGHVSFCIWDHDTMLIQTDGIATLMPDGAARTKIIDKLAMAADTNPEFWPPLLRFGNNEYDVFKITPTWMRALDLSTKTISSKLSPFTDIINTYAK